MASEREEGKHLINPYEYILEEQSFFVLLHAPHNPRESMRKLKVASERKLSFEIDLNVINGHLLNAHDPRSYPRGELPVRNYREAHPSRYLSQLHENIPVKFDLKTPRLLTYENKLKKLLEGVKKDLVIGNAFLWILNFNLEDLEEWQLEENFTLEEFLRAKEILENPPFIASGRGIKPRRLKEVREEILKVSKRISRIAEILNLNLEALDEESLRFFWEEVVKALWELYGIINEIWIRERRDYERFVELHQRTRVPFLGLTDDPKLATETSRLERREKGC